MEDCFWSFGGNSFGFCFRNGDAGELSVNSCYFSEIDPNVPSKPALDGLRDFWIDLSVSRNLSDSELSDCRPIYVVNQKYFAERQIIFRKGMNDVYSISKKKIGSAVVMTISDEEYPISYMHSAFEDFKWQNMADNEKMHNKLFELFAFRCQLAELTTSSLLASKGKGNILDFIWVLVFLVSYSGNDNVMCVQGKSFDSSLESRCTVYGT